MSSATVPSDRPAGPSTRVARLRRAAVRVALPGLLLAPLLIPPAADARTVRSNNVTASGGQVSCYVVHYGGRGIECMAQSIPSGEGDGYLALRPTGKARRGARGDYPGYGGSRRKLRNGDVWRPRNSASGIVCTVRSGALGCANGSSHGFALSPSDYRRF